MPYTLELEMADRGIMPEAGGLWDQPANFVDALVLTNQARAAKMKEEMEHGQVGE